MPCKHYELMLLYLEDCKRSVAPWLSWECRETKNGVTTLWYPLKDHPTWDANLEYRRLVPTPLAPHVEFYLLDCANMERPWELWEKRYSNASGEWKPLTAHPMWAYSPYIEYRRQFY